MKEIVIMTDDGCFRRLYKMTEEEYDKVLEDETNFEYESSAIEDLELVTAEQLKEMYDFGY